MPRALSTSVFSFKASAALASNKDCISTLSSNALAEFAAISACAPSNAESKARTCRFAAAAMASHFRSAVCIFKSLSSTTRSLVDRAFASCVAKASRSASAAVRSASNAAKRPETASDRLVAARAAASEVCAARRDSAARRSASARSLSSAGSSTSRSRVSCANDCAWTSRDTAWASTKAAGSRGSSISGLASKACLASKASCSLPRNLAACASAVRARSRAAWSWWAVAAAAFAMAASSPSRFVKIRRAASQSAAAVEIVDAAEAPSWERRDNCNSKEVRSASDAAATFKAFSAADRASTESALVASSKDRSCRFSAYKSSALSLAEDAAESEEFLESFAEEDSRDARCSSFFKASTSAPASVSRWRSTLASTTPDCSATRAMRSAFSLAFASSTLCRARSAASAAATSPPPVPPVPRLGDASS
mmetsp:Transcript_12819/g.44343  ORF Transcript_12819/g.44343 Transcript_12819/m.44343 type:complete len:425 (-) Transcript_12819:410-1684(-)